MRGNPQVLSKLRELLKYELTAINQSFLHARMCLDWGYDVIASVVRKYSIANMVFAEQLVDRILFLEGMPNLRDTYPLRVGMDVHKIHANDLDLCRRTVDCANLAIDLCADLEDDASRELVRRILDKEEQRLDWLEAQLTVISETGLGLYLAQQMRKR